MSRTERRSLRWPRSVDWPGLSVGHRSWVLGGLLALSTASAPFLARLSINGRFGPGAGLAGWMDALATVGVVGPALGAGVVAAATDDDVERVGVTFLAVFALLAAVVPAATVPAVAAAVGGGSVVLARRLPLTDWRSVPAVAALLGVAVTALSAMGVGPAAGRSVGAHLVLLGGAASPALVLHGNRDWALGGLTGGVLVGVGLGSPFLTGAVALVGGGIVTTNLLVMAGGLGGLVTTASAGLRTRRWPALLGACLLIVAGVPATLPRVLAATLGVSLLAVARGGDRP
jgi:hypothetical protein